MLRIGRPKPVYANASTQLLNEMSRRDVAECFPCEHEAAQPTQALHLRAVRAAGELDEVRTSSIPSLRRISTDSLPGIVARQDDCDHSASSLGA
jgi:hypothetical protein